MENILENDCIYNENKSVNYLGVNPPGNVQDLWKDNY